MTAMHPKRIFRKTALFILITLLLALAACIDDVDDVDLPDYDPKIVVSAFISPGDFVKVKVFRSVPIFYNLEMTDWMVKYPMLKDATVVLINTTESTQLSVPFNPMLEQYVLDPEIAGIKAGNEYELRVSAPGLESVNATTLVPDPAPQISDMNIEMRSISYGTELIITGVINDTPDQRNFYYIMGYETNSYSYWENDSVIEVTHSYISYSNYFSDADRDGQEIGFRVSVQIYEGTSQYDLFILSVDETYFRYHMGLDSYYEADGNPFAEAVILHSNVTSGLGVFASFNPYHISVDLQDME